MAKNILILTGDAVEALEVYYPYYRCLEEGHQVTIAAPTKKVLQTVVHTFEGWQTFTERVGYTIDAHAAFDEVNPEEFDALVIPGGRAPEHIRMHTDFARLAAHFFDTDKPILTLCHAGVALTRLGDRLKGRKLTAFYSVRPDVEAMGATYITEKSHVDRNLVSGHAWDDLPAITAQFMKLLAK